jgi:uncharacterized lipoprotein YddW (UPF0748 family)
MRGIMIYSNEITLENTEKIVKKLNNLQFTDIFFVTKNIDGKVFYSSKIAEVVEDKLSLLCRLADKYNMNVYAWFCTFTEGYEGELFGSGISRFLQENPDCAAINRDGKTTLEKPVLCDYGLENYVCPANQNAQEYELKLISEIVLNYPVKGIHLDLIRYPFPGDYCYCASCRQKFEQEFGIPIGSEESKRHMLKWKQNTITNFVNKIHTEIKKLNKDVKISALVWKYDDCLEKMQDWKEWDIDFVTPMFYHKGYWKKIKWIKEEINKNKQISSKNIIAAVGGTYSNLFTKNEWNFIEKTVTTTEAEGLLYGHYGLLDVIETLEGESRMIEDIKKMIKWNILRYTVEAKKILARITPNIIKTRLKNWRVR